MNTKPIIFNSWSIPRIIDGSKGLTRRVMRPQPTVTNVWCNWMDEWATAESQRGEVIDEWRCPYGISGDLLWVRETYWEGGRWALDVYGEEWEWVSSGTVAGYCATDKVPVYTRKHPSIHMPRKASRLTLRVSNVRVERVQNISDLDCWSEGIDEDAWNEAEHYQVGGSPLRGGSPERCVFATLWDSIHGPGAWERNDWVWVVEWDKVWEKNVDEVAT